MTPARWVAIGAALAALGLVVVAVVAILASMPSPSQGRPYTPPPNPVPTTPAMPR